VQYLASIDFQAPGFGEFYDELPLWSAPFGLMLLERVAPRSHMTILDVGAGTGWLSIELAERCRPETTVIAVYPWRSGLDRLRQKVIRLGLSNVVVLEGDASVLDLASASVDLIVSNLGVNNFDNPSAVLATCFRVAKGGATFCLTTNPVGHMAEFYDEYTAVLASLGQHDRLPVLETGFPPAIRGRVRPAAPPFHPAGVRSGMGGRRRTHGHRGDVRSPRAQAQRSRQGPWRPHPDGSDGLPGCSQVGGHLGWTSRPVGVLRFRRARRTTCASRSSPGISGEG